MNGTKMEKRSKVVELHQVADVIDSLHQTPEYSSLGYPMVRVTDIKGGFLNTSNCLKVSPEIFKEYIKKYLPKRGDIVISRVGSYGITSYVNHEFRFCLGQNTAIIVPKIDDRYLFYCFQSDYVKNQIENCVVGSSQKTLSLKLIKDLKISVFDSQDQHNIARILGSLDDKIELNRQMNETLEAMGRAIFKSWFMDFDPVRAKARGGQPAGIDVETMAQLPERFEDSEIGEIPSGWKIEHFEKILRHSTERIGSEPAVEYSATVTGLTLRDERFNKQLSKTREKNKKIVKGDFVFGLSRKVVNFGLMKEKIGSVSPVYEIFKVNSDIYIPELLEMKIRYDMSNYIDILKPSAREGQGIDREYLLSKVILVPDMRIQKKYFQIYSLLQQKIESNEQQSRTLAQIRDELLPKLMNGEIQVEGMKEVVT